MWAGSFSPLTLNSSMEETKGHDYEKTTRQLFFFFFPQTRFFSIIYLQNFLLPDFMVFMRVAPEWTGQTATWPLESPYRGGGRNTCHPPLTSKWGWEARNIMSKLARWESACEGSRWQIWRYASPAAANTLNNCTPQILPLVAPLGPLPSLTSRTLTCAPYATIRTSANGSACTGEGPKLSLMGGWHSWLWICTAC